MPSKDLEKMTLDELREKLEQTTKALFEHRHKLALKELTNHSLIRATRKDVARIKQAIARKERESSGAAV